MAVIRVTTATSHTGSDNDKADSSSSPDLACRSRWVGSVDIEKGSQQQHQDQRQHIWYKYQIQSPLRSGYHYGLENSPTQYPTPREHKHAWGTMRGNPMQRIRIKWIALTNRSKYCTMGIACTILLLISISLLDTIYWSYQTQPFLNHDTMFTVVMNTYKRPDQLASGVRHYAQVCGRKFGVAHVYVIWAEEDTAPPNPDIFFRDHPSLKNNVQPMPNKNLAGVSFRRVKNSLNSRFLPIPGVTEGIFMVDDDIRVDCISLKESFRAWKANPDSMVGYYPRFAKKRKSGYVYQSWPSIFFQGRINMVLTKACFLHSRFMELYSSEQHPQEIRDYVDQYFNCEDVAMSMLVANITQSENHRAAKPIYVEAKVSDKGLFNGISTGTGHFQHRSDCLDKLTEIYLQNGWEAPLDDSFSLEESAWVKHVPGFWWQAQASNLFEWAAIENVLK